MPRSLKNLFGLLSVRRPLTGRKSLRGGFPLGVEALESRQLLSTTPALSITKLYLSEIVDLFNDLLTG